MNFSLLSLMSYPLWTLTFALFIPIVAVIATFVCLRRANTPKKLIGFFIIIPIFVAVTAILCADTGSIVSGIFHEVAVYPLIGFLCAICLGMICLNFIALMCGAGLLKRSGAIINSIATLICLSANIFLTYNACAFAHYTCENKLFRNDAGCIYIKDFFAVGNSEIPSFLPDWLTSLHVENLALAILAVYLIIYFLSFIALKSPELLAKEELERRRRAALLNTEDKKMHREKHADHESQEDDHPNCCAYCEHATALKGDRLRMICDKRGVVSTSHVCRKFLYDPLKRNASRPLIPPLSDNIGDLSGEDHI
ncbi:MAG: hypothetical protein IJD70_06195 [Clostridia bacterium]|nr:hypothetical protein [Clostridia bacterium]